MPPLDATDAFLILEFIAGNRGVPNAVFAALLTSLPSSSACPRTSPRLRKALVLRALHAALHDEAAASASASASCSSTFLLRKARRVLADPDAASCFPHEISFGENEENDGARAAAAVSDLKRLLDDEWNDLPPSTLELVAVRIAGDGALQTWAAADQTKRAKLRLLVGESRGQEILAKLMQEDASASRPPILQEAADEAGVANEADGARRDHAVDPLKENNEADRAQGVAGHQNALVDGARRDNEVGPSKESNEADRTQEGLAGHQNASADGARRDDEAGSFKENNEAGRAQGLAGHQNTSAAGARRDDEAGPSKENNEVDRAQEGVAGHQNASVKGAERVKLSEKSVPASKKCSLMERNPNATIYEWDGLGESDDDDRLVGKRNLPFFGRKPNPSHAYALKSRKKWSDREEKTLLEGVEKYGKGNWKDIKLAYPDVFEERSTVDLKDKFRNMERYQP